LTLSDVSSYTDHAVEISVNRFVLMQAKRRKKPSTPSHSWSGFAATQNEDAAVLKLFPVVPVGGKNSCSLSFCAYMLFGCEFVADSFPTHCSGCAGVEPQDSGVGEALLEKVTRDLILIFPQFGGLLFVFGRRMGVLGSGAKLGTIKVVPAVGGTHSGAEADGVDGPVGAIVFEVRDVGY
jgi:hypothetical protein